jgi:hypothetical protein
MAIKLYVFTKGRQDLPRIPNKEGMEVKHIQFESTRLDDLLLIAKFRIINYPMSVLVDGQDHVLLRMKGALNDRLLDNVAQ